LQKDIKKNIIKFVTNKEHINAGDKSVIMQALGDARVPPSERSMDRLLDEGQVIIFAGTETSSRALSVGMFYLLNQKSLIANVRTELARVAHIPDEELTLKDLEPLPYLVRPR
jgi:cytochrome P450